MIKTNQKGALTLPHNYTKVPKMDETNPPKNRIITYQDLDNLQKLYREVIENINLASQRIDNDCIINRNEEIEEEMYRKYCHLLDQLQTLEQQEQFITDIRNELINQHKTTEVCIVGRLKGCNP